MELPVSLDEPLQLGKEFLDGIEVWRVRRQVQKLHSGVSTQLLDPVRVVERRIVHH
jgi:hypothetical protein